MNTNYGGRGRCGSGILIVGLCTTFVVTACTKNPTSVTRELGARPRVEQLALSTAMGDAYQKIDFGFVSGKRVFVATKSLAKTDIEFITSFVQKKVLAAGGNPILEEKDAQLGLTSTLDVSGTDEVEKVGKDVVMGQFKGTLTAVDLSSGKILNMYDLNSVVQTKRNRRATTKIIK